MSSYIGPFKIIKELGHGAVGKVYHAIDSNLKRDVALKVLLSGEFADDSEINRFQREVESCATLRHPNIVPLYEVGQEKGQGLYMVMELIEGPSLEQYIENYQISPHHCAQILYSLAKAIGYAHRNGIIHRDIKPQNILMKHARIPMLTDFGLARKYNDEKDKLTKTGEFLGTPGHMPPEQINGEPPSPQMDIYSLGTVFYELLTKKPLYVGDEMQILYNILDETEEPIAPRRLNPQISKDLNTICQKAIAKNPKRRYKTIAELLRDIELYLQGKPIQSRPIGRFEKVYKWTRRNKIKAITLALCFLALISGIIFTKIYKWYVNENERKKLIIEGDKNLKLLEKGTVTLKIFRAARIEYEKALTKDRRNKETLKKVYNLEIRYGQWALKNDHIERVRDAYYNAKSTGIETTELKKLKMALNKEDQLQKQISIAWDKFQSTKNRREALINISKRDDSKSLKYLIMSLTNTTKDISQIAQEIIISLPQKQRNAILLQSLPYINKTHSLAIAKLIKKKKESAAIFLPFLKNKHDWIVKNALAILSVIKNEEHIPYLKPLVTNNNISIKIELCETLGNMNSHKVVPLLLPLLKSSKKPIVIAAIEALTKLSTKAQAKGVKQELLRKIDFKKDHMLAYYAWNAILKIYPKEGLKKGRDILLSDKINEQIAEKIWKNIVELHPKKMYLFIKFLPKIERLEKNRVYLDQVDYKPFTQKLFYIFKRVKNTQMRIKIIRYIRGTQGKNNFIIFSKMLREKKSIVREEAAFSLCCCSKVIINREVLKNIYVALKNETNTQAIIYLLWTISKFKKEYSFFRRKILQKTKEKDIFIKLSSFMVLGQYASQKNIRQIERILRNGNTLEIQYAAWIFGELKEKPKHLKGNFKKISIRSNKSVRYYIENAINKIK